MGGVALGVLDRFLHWSLDWYINHQWPGWGYLQLWQWRVCTAYMNTDDSTVGE